MQRRWLLALLVALGLIRRGGAISAELLGQANVVFGGRDLLGLGDHSVLGHEWARGERRREGLVEKCRGRVGGVVARAS